MEAKFCKIFVSFFRPRLRQKSCQNLCSREKEVVVLPTEDQLGKQPHVRIRRARDHRLALRVGRVDPLIGETIEFQDTRLASSEMFLSSAIAALITVRL